MSSGDEDRAPRVALAAMALALSALALGLVTGRGGSAFGSEPWHIAARPVAATIVLGLGVVAVVRAVRSTPRPRSTPEGLDPRLVWLVVGLASACVLAVHVLPRWFDSIAREDGVVEWVSALAAAWACASMLRAARGRPWAVRVPMWALGAAFFVVAGEELSWLQRLLGYGTPELLDANSQGETTLHNMATDRFQGAYYLAAGVALVLLPHLARWCPRAVAPLRPFVAGRVPLALAVVSVPFAYARTGNVVHHVTFWLAVAVVLWWDKSAPRPWATALLGLVVGGQLLMFVAGPDMVRPWAPDEYREMFTAMAFAAWARELVNRSATTDPSLVASSSTAR